jgi:hypothetical protein
MSSEITNNTATTTAMTAKTLTHRGMPAGAAVASFLGFSFTT